MDSKGRPSKAEIAENRRRLALDYAIRVSAENGKGVVENAVRFENYLAGKKNK